METEILQSAGLTKGESKVYMALLKIGESSVGNIAKEADVSLSKIYEVLENLMKKGLAGFIMRNNVKHFSPSDPSLIIDYMENKKKEISKSEEKIKEILPSLNALKKSKTAESTAAFYEGFKGIKTFYETLLNILNKEDEISVMGIPRYAAEKYEGYFLDWNKRRVKQGINLKAIYNFDVKDLGKKRAKLKLTKIKYLSEKFTTPAWILITANIVATIHLTEKPVCIVIKDKDIAESYLNFFNIFWQHSK